MDNILVYATSLAIGVGIILEVVKHSVNVKDRILPLLGIVIGVVVSFAVSFVPENVIDLSMQAQVLAGGISGLMATGFYENAKQFSKQNHD